MVKKILFRNVSVAIILTLLLFNMAIAGEKNDMLAPQTIVGGIEGASANIISAPATETAVTQAKYNLSISMGGTKYTLALVDKDGRLINLIEFKWKKEMPTAEADELADLIFKKMCEIIDTEGAGIDNVGLIGIAFAGPLDDKNGIVGKPFPAPNQPFDNYPLANNLRNKFMEKYGKSPAFKIINDGEASRLCRNSVLCHPAARPRDPRNLNPLYYNSLFRVFCD